MPDTAHHRIRLTCFLFGLAAIHGLLVNLTPVMFTTMEKNFGIDESNQAMLKSCFFIGTSAALLVSGYLTVLWGPRPMTIITGVAGRWRQRPAGGPSATMTVPALECSIR